MLIKQEGSINEKIKKLFLAKKVIAMILAVAMVATMLPTTTYAATVSGNAPEQSEESTALQAEIVISESQLQSKAQAAGFTYDSTTKKVATTYDVENENPFGDFH